LELPVALRAKALKDLSLGKPGDAISGAIGGGIVGQILAGVLGGAAGGDVGSMDVASVVKDIVGGGVGDGHHRVNPQRRAEVLGALRFCIEKFHCAGSPLGA
jgi:hypothetical protein